MLLQKNIEDKWNHKVRNEKVLEYIGEGRSFWIIIIIIIKDEQCLEGTY